MAQRSRQGNLFQLSMSVCCFRICWGEGSGELLHILESAELGTKEGSKIQGVMTYQTTEQVPPSKSPETNPYHTEHQYT